MEPAASASCSDAFFSFTSSSPQPSRRSGSKQTRRSSPSPVESKPALNFVPDLGDDIIAFSNGALASQRPQQQRPAATAAATSVHCDQQRADGTQAASAALATAKLNASGNLSAVPEVPDRNAKSSGPSEAELQSQDSGLFVRPINLAAAFFDRDSPDQNRSKRPPPQVQQPTQQQQQPAQQQQPVAQPAGVTFNLGMASAQQQQRRGQDTTTPRRRVLRGKTPAASPIRVPAPPAALAMPSMQAFQQQQPPDGTTGNVGFNTAAGPTSVSAAAHAAEPPKQVGAKPVLPSFWGAAPAAATAPDASSLGGAFKRPSTGSSEAAPTTARAPAPWPTQPSAQPAGAPVAASAATTAASAGLAAAGQAPQGQEGRLRRPGSILDSSFQGFAKPFITTAAAPVPFFSSASASAAAASHVRENGSGTVPSDAGGHPAGAAAMPGAGPGLPPFGAATPAPASVAFRATAARAAASVMPTPMFPAGAFGLGGARMAQVMPTPLPFPTAKPPAGVGLGDVPGQGPSAGASAVSDTPISFVAGMPGGGDSGGRRGPGTARRRPPGSRTPPPAARPPQPPRAPPSATSDASSSGSLLSSFTFAVGATPMTGFGGGGPAPSVPPSAFGLGSTLTPASSISEGVPPPSATAPWAAVAAAVGAGGAARATGGEGRCTGGAAAGVGAGGAPGSVGVSAFPGFSPMSWSPSDSLASSLGKPYFAAPATAARGAPEATPGSSGVATAGSQGEASARMGQDSEQVQRAAAELASLNLVKDQGPRQQGLGQAQGQVKATGGQQQQQEEGEHQGQADDCVPVRDVQGAPGGHGKDKGSVKERDDVPAPGAVPPAQQAPTGQPPAGFPPTTPLPGAGIFPPGPTPVPWAATGPSTVPGRRSIAELAAECAHSPMLMSFLQQAAEGEAQMAAAERAAAASMARETPACGAAPPAAATPFSAAAVPAFNPMAAATPAFSAAPPPATQPAAPSAAPLAGMQASAFFPFPTPKPAVPAAGGVNAATNAGNLAAQAAAVFGQPAAATGPAPGAAGGASAATAAVPSTAAGAGGFLFAPVGVTTGVEGAGGMAPDALPTFNVAVPQANASTTPGRRGQRHKRTTPVRAARASGLTPSATAAPGAPQPTAPSAAAGAPRGLSAAEVAQYRSLASGHKEAGNTSFQAARYGQAEKFYTLAINALEAIREGGIDLAVLLSNRAGARLMIGQPLGALEDARRAVTLDPKFIRAVVRVATCHLRMGEFGAAHALVSTTLARLSPSGQHWQDVQKKAKEVEEAAAQMTVLRETLAAAGPELPRDKLTDLLARMDQLQPQVLYSEEMAALRARALLQAGQLGEAARALEVGFEGTSQLKVAPWRLWLEVQTRYLQGDLPAALTTCQALVTSLGSTAKDAPSSATRAEGDPPGDGRFGADKVAKVVGVPTREGAELAVTHINKLLKLKEDGNAAVKSKQLAQAVECYSSALVLGCSTPFAAVLHSNRAAAYQGLGNLTDALADCGRARALDPGFVRAHTRMAALLLEAKRCEAAQATLEALSSSSSSGGGAGTPGGIGARLSADERAAVATQLGEVRAAARWQRTPDHYRLLSLQRGCGDEDVRRAYRKAALRYHPDKALSACRFACEFPAAACTAGGEGGKGGEGGLAPMVLRQGGGAEIEARLREEAATLFNLINQANEELADRHRRAKVDQLLDVEAQGPAQMPTHTPRHTAYAYPSSTYKGAGYTAGFGASNAGSYTGYRRPGSTYGAGTAAGAAPGSASYARYFNQQGQQQQQQQRGTAGPKTRQQSQAGSRWGGGTAYGSGHGWHETSGGYGSESD